MVLDDTHLQHLNHPDNYALYAQYYVPQPPSTKNGNGTSHSSRNSITPMLTTRLQKCAYSSDDPSSCTSQSSKTSCDRTPGCEWNTTTDPPTCKQKSCECTVLAKPVLSKCARFKKGVFCKNTAGCHWDEEFAMCVPDASMWHMALACGLSVPVIYLATYLLYTKDNARKMWVPFGSVLPRMYMVSVVFATIAYIFLIASVTYSQKHIDNRADFSRSLFMVIVGAVMVPLFRTLYVASTWSEYWVLVALFVTSAGTMWFVGNYLHSITERENTNVYRRTAYSSVGNWIDMLAEVCAVFVLFHVLVVDNLGWWSVFVGTNIRE